MEYPRDHLHEQGGGRDAGTREPTRGFRCGQRMGQHVPLPLCADLKKIYRQTGICY